MELFRSKKIIEGMMRKSLYGMLRVMYDIESYGFAFSLIMGKEKLAYACFYNTDSGNTECVTEFSNYESMLFGEVYDGKPTHIKRKEFVTFCHENGIGANVTDYFLSLLGRMAVGEKISPPALSGSTVSGELLGEALACRHLLISGDELALISKIAEVHSMLSSIDRDQFPFGYSHRYFNEAWNLNLKKAKRAKGFSDYIIYISECAQKIGRMIESHFLLELIEKETIKKDQL